MSEKPAAMVERVVLILDAFKGAQGALRLSDLVDITGLPRSSVHRIMLQLRSAGWIDHGDGGYRLGIGIFELGSVVDYRNRVVTAARPYMRELSAGRFVTHLAVLSGRDVVYIDKLGGAFAGKLPSRIGGRLPAHCTGVGKAILAHSDARLVDEYLRERLVRKTTATIADEDAMRRELTRIRAAGAAYDAGEAVEGVACVAAPIFENGEVHAAISACALADSVDVTLLRSRVTMAADAVSRRLSQPTMLVPQSA